MAGRCNKADEWGQNSSDILIAALREHDEEIFKASCTISVTQILSWELPVIGCDASDSVREALQIKWGMLFLHHKAIYLFFEGCYWAKDWPSRGHV